MPDFDPKQIIQMQTTSSEKIDVTKGKVQRQGQYVSPAEAKQVRQQQAEQAYDPIFDTPPTFKPQYSDSNIQSLDEVRSTARTPINPGRPAQATPVIHGGYKPKEEVPDPTPLKVMNNFVPSADMGSMESFNPASLPKKVDKTINLDEQDALNDLELGVDAELESITERVDALTAKQYEEFVEAKTEGKTVAHPESDAELDAERERKINGEQKDDSEESIKKTIKIGGKVASVDKSQNEQQFVNSCLEAYNYVKNKVTAADYFDRCLHARKFLEQQNVYAELWAIVMHNNATNEVAVHPFLVAKKNGFVGILEVNIENIAGIHVLEPNDTVEGVYNNFFHRGYLYEYLDFNDDIRVLKLPSDMPTAQKAIELASKGGVKLNTPETNTEAVTEQPDEFENAVKNDEATALKELANEETDSKESEEESINKTFVIPNKAHTEEHKVEVEPAPVETPKKKLVIESSYEGEAAKEGAINISNIKNDLELELGEDAQVRTDEEILEDMKSAVKANIKVMKRLDLSNFTIDDTPISASQVAGFSIKDVNTADHVLPNAGKGISVRGVNGPELFSMNPQNSTKNRINTFRQIYGIIYRHITSPKPNTFDEWLKVTRFSDIDHIYAAIHKATFAGSNYVHYECPECHHIWLQDYDFDTDMIKYASEEAKTRIRKIFESGDFSIAGYEIELHQISDQYVVGLKDPSIWNMVMETASLSEEFLEKYEDLLDTMSFIDSIYMIDEESMKLKPIDFGYDKSNPAKSTAKKITILSDIIQTLPSDNYFELRTRIAELFQTSEDMTYQIPATECPKCGAKIEAEDVTAQQILFRRHQTGAIAAL